MPESDREPHVAVADSSLLHLYHERWGHQDIQYVQKLKKDLKINIKGKREICKPCIYQQFHCLSFSIRDKTTVPEKLLSVNICGPLHVSFQKRRYLVEFKDACIIFHYDYIRKEPALKDMSSREKQDMDHKFKLYITYYTLLWKFVCNC